MASFNRKWIKEYDPEDNKEEVRTVGLEIETKITNNKCLLYSDNLYEAERMCRREGVNWSTVEIGSIYFDAMDIQIGGWGYDGGDKEFVTEPDSITLFNKGGSERFNKFVNWLFVNAEPIESSGTHIHIGKLDSDPDYTTDNIYWFMTTFGTETQKIFGRNTHWARVPLRKELRAGSVNNKVTFFMKPEKHGKMPEQSKGDIVVDRDHTYEFRGPKATVSKLEMLAWVQYCHNIVDICSKNECIDGIKFSEFLKGEYIEKYIKKVLSVSRERKIERVERYKTIKRAEFVPIVIRPQDTYLLK